MEKYNLQGLQVIDRKLFDSLAACSSIFPDDWIALILLLSGSLELGDGTSLLSLSEKEVFTIIPPFRIVKLEDSVLLSAVCFTYDFAISSKLIQIGQGYLNLMFSKPGRNTQLTGKKAERLAMQIKSLHKNITNEHTIPFQNEIVMLWFNLILYEFSSLYLQEHAGFEVKISRKEKLFLQFIALVQLHSRKEHSVRYYADTLFVTRGYLGKTVRVISMLPAKHFIEMAIVSEAYTLLADHRLSVADIADELYFTSASSFSNFFKRHAKVSPRVYRETM